MKQGFLGGQKKVKKKTDEAKKPSSAPRPPSVEETFKDLLRDANMGQSSKSSGGGRIKGGPFGSFEKMMKTIPDLGPLTIEPSTKARNANTAQSRKTDPGTSSTAGNEEGWAAQQEASMRKSSSSVTSDRNVCSPVPSGASSQATSFHSPQSGGEQQRSTASSDSGQEYTTAPSGLTPDSRKGRDGFGEDKSPGAKRRGGGLFQEVRTESDSDDAPDEVKHREADAAMDAVPGLITRLSGGDATQGGARQGDGGMSSEGGHRRSPDSTAGGAGGSAEGAVGDRDSVATASAREHPHSQRPEEEEAERREAQLWEQEWRAESDARLRTYGGRKLTSPKELEQRRAGAKGEQAEGGDTTAKAQKEPKVGKGALGKGQQATEEGQGEGATVGKVTDKGEQDKAGMQKEGAMKDVAAAKEASALKEAPEVPAKPSPTARQLSALEHRKQGNAHFKNGDLKAALKCHIKASLDDPDGMIIQANLVATYVRLEKYSQAVTLERQAQAAMEKVGKDEPSRMAAECDLHWWLHLAHKHLGEGRKALESLKIVIRRTAQLHHHDRFKVAVEAHREVRLELEKKELVAKLEAEGCAAPTQRKIRPPGREEKQKASDRDDMERVKAFNRKVDADKPLSGGNMDDIIKIMDDQRKKNVQGLGSFEVSQEETRRMYERHDAYKRRR